MGKLNLRRSCQQHLESQENAQLQAEIPREQLCVGQTGQEGGEGGVGIWRTGFSWKMPIKHASNPVTKQAC